MKLRTLMTMIRSGHLLGSLSLIRRSTELYRTIFVAAASSAGLLSFLDGNRRSFDEIASHLSIEPAVRPVLEAWLGVGVRLKELGREGERYWLRGRFARSLAGEDRDVIAANLEEMVRFHGAVLLAAPTIKDNERLTLSDQDGAVIARSSRIIEPFVHEAVDLVIPPSGAMRLLEIGCGSGTHMRYAGCRNKELFGIGLELQAKVAEDARVNLSSWGLGKRFEVAVGDLRTFSPDGLFDVITMHNNIYYFEEGERVAVLERVRGMLRPSGRLLLTTGCVGGNLALDLISLWFTASSFGGPLPSPDRLLDQLQQAGLAECSARNLIPGDAFYAFVASQPG